MRETQILDRIRKLAARAPRSRTLIQGIGDDCAILRPDARHDLVFTSDFLLEDRHFTRAIYSPADIGHKALARGLSDIAAMGAEPIFCLVSLGIPRDLPASWVPSFYKGFLALATRYKTSLAGGDLARFEKIIVDVTCCGRVPRGKALLRSAAKPGDAIYVTGKLGKKKAWLEKDWRRNRRPEPRIHAGIALRRLGIRCAMDISDGLSLDLHRLCVESKVGADITAHLSDDALHSGEAYELLFTAPPRLAVPPRIETTPVASIGVITSQHKGRVLFQGRPLAPLGFDHFAGRD
ncbi:MAG: thiamine-phosphate kinase [Acidobacteriaceae bacterium]|nr:thiamine-phosphate kinase [Acidobacteriaceae bacterium]